MAKKGQKDDTAVDAQTVPPEGRIAAMQKLFLQREAALDACVVSGNHITAVQARRTALQDSGAQIVKILDDIMKATVSTCGGHSAVGSNTMITVRKDGAVSMEPISMISALSEACSDAFRRECGLELTPHDVWLSEEPVDGTGGGGENGADASAIGLSGAAEKRIVPLQRLLSSIDEIQQIPLYNILLSASKKGSMSADSAIHLVKALKETVQESLDMAKHGYANCPNSAGDIAEWASWMQPLVRLTSECLQEQSLERVMEAPRERLRRVAFDVKEKQREQEDAVTDGDMVRSEQLYFEKTALLESMRPLYDELEAVIEQHKKDAGDEPSRQTHTLAQELGTALAPKLLDKERQLKIRGEKDLERLATYREQVTAARTAQKARYNVYLAKWDKLFEHNKQQQDSCLRAIEELEQRLRHLAQERTFLVEDRLDVTAQEQQQSEDAAAFMLFANQFEANVRQTLRNVEQSLACGERIFETTRTGYQQLRRYLHDVVQHEADEQLLEVRKERLEHFRGLYLTLGELQYKKERHMEELDKRIEYYHVQQELAMDTFNPKAKEFSKAKKDLLEVKETMQQQVELIAQKATQQLEDFRPTEKLLIASGVNFLHPVQELAEMNERRNQKLLEYHTLMSTMREEKGEEASAS
ncbi:putative paraflagellar rod protein [Trypanosoma vivax]|nr:putative paraflagellar rod protein [Trypanosoma vivax]